MKKVSKLPILFLAIFIFTKSSLAESNEVMLNINEKPVPSPAILEDNSILVPIRVISENLGFDVQWNNENKEIILLKNQDLLKLKVGSNVLKQNNESIILDQSPKIINNLTYLPVTFLDKLINYNLSPAENEKSINITTSEINNLNKKDYLGYEKTNEIEILRQAILKNKNLVDLNVKRKNCFFARFVREFSYLTYMDKVTYIVDKDDNVTSVDLGMAKEHFNKIKLTDNKAEEIVENLKLRDNSLSDLSKVKKIHDYIITNTDYDLNSEREDAYTAYGALIENKAVCSGYSKAFQLLAHKSGVQTIYVSGVGNNGYGQESHAWNKVKLDGYWYNIDVTWDDPIGSSKELNYDYFLKSDNEIPDHIPNNDIAYPDAIKSNNFRYDL